MPAESPLRAGQYDNLELIETFRFDPELGFVRLGRHLARLEESAKALGFKFSKRNIEAKLNAPGSARRSLRVRLTLNAKGEIGLTSQPFAALPPDTIWRLEIAETRLSSTDPLLRHKTSRRDLYDKAHAEFSRGEADEVLLLNEKDEVCEGAITSLFIQTPRGDFITPALHCGLLAGVLRQEMLEEGKAKEAHISATDLTSASAIFVGNSLRGLIRATFDNNRL